MDKKKFFAAIALMGSGAVYLNYLLSGTATTVIEARSIVTNDKLVEAQSDDSERVDTQAIQTQITQLQQQIEEINRQVLLQGGLSEPTIFDYEGDWCVAGEDLSKEDQTYANSQKQEWINSQSLGEIYVEGNQAVHDDMVQYLAMDLEVLKQFAQNDDRAALRVLSGERVAGVDSKTAYHAAKRLLVLGEWQSGIDTLIFKELLDAEFLAETPEQAQHGVIRALGYAELGFQHNYVYGLQAILNVIKNKPKLREVIRNTDANLVSHFTKKVRNEINTMRIAEGIVPLGQEKIPRIALYEFQTSIAMMYDRDEDKQALNLLQDETLLPHHWKTQYLNTPCIKRQIATREAKFHQLPAIRAEIAQLQSQLDALNNSQ